MVTAFKPNVSVKLGHAFKAGRACVAVTCVEEMAHQPEHLRGHIEVRALDLDNRDVCSGIATILSEGREEVRMRGCCGSERHIGGTHTVEGSRGSQ